MFKNNHEFCSLLITLPHVMACNGVLKNQFMLRTPFAITVRSVLFEKSTQVSEEHLAKASQFMTVTLDGILIDVSPVQP